MYHFTTIRPYVFAKSHLFLQLSLIILSLLQILGHLQFDQIGNIRFERFIK